MSQSSPSEPRYDTLFQLITQRMYWFFIGPMILILLLLGLINSDNPQIGLLSGIYLLALAGMIVSRWLEIRTGNAVTADGQPATWQHFWKYTFLTLAIGLAALVAANAWIMYS